MESRSISVSEEIMRVSVLIGSRNRPEVLRRCIESILAQNHDDFEVVVLNDASDDPSTYTQCIQQFRDPRISLIRSETQLGVAGGRNHLFKRASGEIFFIVDDDAVVVEPNALTHLQQLFAAHPEIGIVACQIIEKDSNGKVSWKVPFPKKSLARSPDLVKQPQFVSYFLGGAHAIRRQVIETCGDYHPELMFGEEELELAYRAIEHRWKIFYEPKVIVHHYPQPSVLTHSNAPASELYHHIKNRIYLAYRYIPVPYLLSYLPTWLTIYFWMSIRAKTPLTMLRGACAGIQMIRRVQRRPLREPAISYLRAHNGRLWY